MEVTICNPQKGWIETIEASMNEKNTTWFGGRQQTNDIYTITDIECNLLIKENNFNYPVLIYGAPPCVRIDGEKKHSKSTFFSEMCYTLIK